MCVAPGECTDHSHRHPSDPSDSSSIIIIISPLSLLTYYLSTSALGIVTDSPSVTRLIYKGKRYAGLKRTLFSLHLPLHVRGYYSDCFPCSPTSTNYTYSMPTLTSPGNQRTASASMGHSLTPIWPVRATGCT